MTQQSQTISDNTSSSRNQQSDSLQSPFQDVYSQETPPGFGAPNGEDPDGIAKEAEQAFKFRNAAFWGGFFASAVLFIVLVVFILGCWPSEKASAPVVALFCVKASLTAVTFLTVSVATLRFAIRCYGHHQKVDEKRDDLGKVDIAVLSKLLETLKNLKDVQNV